MFQYAKDFFKEKIKKEKEIKEKREKEKKNIEEKLNVIKRYDDLKEEIKSIKGEIVMIFALMLLMTGLFLLASTALEMVYLIVGYNFVVAVLFLPKGFYNLKKCKKEYKKFSQEEVDELRENKESMEELYKKLENEITSSQRSINQYKKELVKISEVEDFKDSNSMNQPFYQADTEKEYSQLVNTQIKPEMTLEEFLNEKEKHKATFDEFLNERVNYEDVHLEVREIDSKARCLVKK